MLTLMQWPIKLYFNLKETSKWNNNFIFWIFFT
jgi:hypothetical protein